MKFTGLLPLATAAAGFVIPDDRVMSQISIQSHETPDHQGDSVFDQIPPKDEIVNAIEDTFAKFFDASKTAFDEALEFAEETGDEIVQNFQESAFDTQSWLDSASISGSTSGKHGKHGRHGRHGRPHKSNMTVYQLIASSKYTTKLAGLISEYDDLVELLNGTAANYTVFAPTDKAFAKIPKDAPKPSKELLKKVLTYHVSSDFYPAGRVLVSHTIPTLLEGKELGNNPQRLSTNIGLRGLTVNFYSRIIAIDIFGTNGVIHGVDSLLIPPPKAVTIIGFLPGEFSTLELALTKTSLLGALNDTSNHVGGTLFAPSNSAFQRLGPRINGFLFSRRGQKYLSALLKYHVVANQTLYSDAYYKADTLDQTNIPKGFFHVDLPTLLEDRSLSIDVARYGRIINMKINGFSSVAVEDGIAKDGVIHVVNNILIPPKQVGGISHHWQGEELSEEDLVARLEPLAEDAEL